MRESLEQRIARFDWAHIRESLNQRGYATTPAILSGSECAALVGLYDESDRLRSRIEMERFRFGIGEYKYFDSPIPPLVAEMRAELYPHVASIANAWHEVMHLSTRFPPDLDAFISICHRSGQRKPTPLLLRYEAGGYNCMHQDLYGDVVFPLQFTFMLSQRGSDYEGGEFLLLEQRPRAQSRCEAIVLEQGAAIVFATRYRPVRGSRGYYRANLRHGVSRIHRGRRFTLGIIFHEAK